ncbi:MAG: peptide ABC transporter ATP-binding protein [Spirochaeta sp. LUC14_002_19_P3]|nr:MAG: peptide ABC transporter ATP-binding protein [Spirochaeta sp. LUC14_002_19_P3]
MKQPLLEVKNLQTSFRTEEGLVRAVDGVSFSLRQGEVLGLAGESGCGKSVTAYSISRLLPMPPGQFDGGEILYKGRDILGLKEEEMRRIRGREIAVVFQEPMSALNPVASVSAQIEEALAIHTSLGKAERKERVVHLLARVGIPDPAQRALCYPHELSGGMRQRVMIAMAVSCDPSLLIADEPTTALDVTIQAQILKLIQDMKNETGSAMLLITHDLAVIAETADRAAIMYAGKLVETAAVKNLFAEPAHPYTRGLLNSIPVLGSPGRKLKSIPGRVPNLIDLPGGCAFANRCELAGSRCRNEMPRMVNKDEGHQVRCHLHDGGVK